MEHVMKYEINLEEIPRLIEYSIVAKPILFGNYYLMPTSHFEFLVKYDARYKLYILNHPATDTFFTGASLDIVDNIMHEELVYIWEMCAKEDDKNLSEQWRKIKYFMLANYMEVAK
jgi:hypothetical protein